MRLLDIILPPFLRTPLKRYYIAMKYDVELGKGTIVTADTVFEGRSVVGKNCDVCGSYIGLGTYIAGASKISGARVGRFCSIGQNVKTGFGLHPSKTFVSTHTSFFSPQKQAGFTFTDESLFEEHLYVPGTEIGKRKYQISIGNDVWIANDTRIMDGISVGDGAIIGLGAIVTKDIEPYSINVGIPSKKLCYRFNNEQIEFLLRFKWWERDFEWIEENARWFRDIDAFMKQFDSNSR